MHQIAVFMMSVERGKGDGANLAPIGWGLAGENQLALQPSGAKNRTLSNVCEFESTDTDRER